jgi:hypothetical protein
MSSPRVTKPFEVIDLQLIRGTTKPGNSEANDRTPTRAAMDTIKCGTFDRPAMRPPSILDDSDTNIITSSPLMACSPTFTGDWRRLHPVIEPFDPYPTLDLRHNRIEIPRS